MFPVQTSIPQRTFPLITWMLIGMNVLVFILEISLSPAQLEQFIYLLGLVPARFTDPEWAVSTGLGTANYWTFLTNMFLHGGWLHLIGNMWTLYIFGGNVEDRMGHRNYLIFYLLCGLIASLTHFLFYPDSTVPAIGASGAISGVMAAFAFMFPAGKIVFLIPVFFLPFFVEINAFFYIAVWFIGQLMSGTFSLMLSQVTGIAFWAHIGGFIAGAVLYRLFLSRYRKTAYFTDEYVKRYLNY